MRMPNAFYADLRAVRNQYGRTEYDREQILPAVIGLLHKHKIKDGDVLRHAAIEVLDNVEKADDQGDLNGELFNLESHIALGERKRIRRGSMNTEQIRRRKRVIDHNKVSQDAAWAKETRWLNQVSDLLEGRSLSTVVEDVLMPSAAAAE